MVFVSSMDVRPDIIKSHNACLESRDEGFKICVCQPLRDGSGSSGNVITTQLISSRLQFLARIPLLTIFYESPNQKSNLSFVRVYNSNARWCHFPQILYNCHFGLSFFSHVLKYAQVESERYLFSKCAISFPFFLA